MHRSKRTHLWCWFFKHLLESGKGCKIVSVWVPSIQWRTIKVRSWILKTIFQEWGSLLSLATICWSWECLRCRVPGRFGSLGQRWFCWNERESPDDTNLADTHDWLGMTQNRWKIDCHGHMLWKYCKSTDIDELQGSNWPFGSDPSGKLPFGYTNPMAVRGHEKYNWPKHLWMAPFVSQTACYHATSFEQVYLYTYICILHVNRDRIESKSVHMIFLAGFQDDLNILNRTTVCNKFFMWKFWTWNFGPVVVLLFCWLQV